MHELAFVLAGFVVGTVVGLTGVGGGSLMTPILIFGFGIKPYLAIGTDLLFAAFTKGGGALALARARLIDWPVVGLLSLGSIPAALATIWVLHRLGPADPAVQHLMTTTLGVALLLTAVAIIFRKQIQDFALRHSEGRENPRRTATLTVVTGAVLGVLVSISSVGAGALGVSALFFLYPRLPTLRIIGSDIAHAVPLTLVAGIGHWMLGSVDWSLLGSLLIGSLPGIWLGSHISTRVPDRVLRPILAGMLVLVGSKLIAA